MLRFSVPVTHVYNPLRYARAPHEAYLRRFARAHTRVLFVGMNPGPWGMAQTGVPFGEVETVRGWMGIEEPVSQPDRPHPKRPIEGFGCRRSEVSGRRLWGLMRSRFGDPDSFFAGHFVANYCPLVFMEETGRNRTPDRLPAGESEPLFALCDRHLIAVIGALEPEWIIGIGRFAAERVSAALAAHQSARSIVGALPRTGSILHPSPANPSANRDWGAVVTRELIGLGVW